MNFLIRADASTQMGTGHVMRCLALAQAHLAVGCPVTFLLGKGSPNLAQRLQNEGIQVIEMLEPWGSETDAQQTIQLAEAVVADWVAVDGYHFGADYQKWLKDAGLRVLVLDDYGHASHYWADVVLNQNITAEEGLYPSREPYTKLLLGTRYVLLRQEFWQWRNWQRQIPLEASKVLVTLGGSDPDNVTLTVIQALQKVEVAGLEAVVVVGGSNPHYGELAQVVKGWEGSITLKQNVTNMPELMAWADLAITAGGSTCWEIAFMGIPSLMIAIAANQKESVLKIGKLDLALVLEFCEKNIENELPLEMNNLITLPQKDYAKMSQNLKKLVDCDSNKRIIGALQNLLDYGEYTPMHEIAEEDLTIEE
jgi:UDP-2,4-diacetamido-2,4,6-trideoxy-beta-L-altropyranose hydrolase